MSDPYISIQTETFRDLVMFRRVRVGPLVYEFDRRQGTRTLYRHTEDGGRR